MIGNTDDSPAKQQEYPLLLMKKQVDGFLFVPASYNVSKTLQKRRNPFVILDRHFPFSQVDWVHCNSFSGAHDLTKHLFEFGHRHIAVISKRKNHTTAIDRVDGYLQAIKEAAVNEDQQIYWGEYTQQAGYENTVQILQSNPQPTEIFATNNFIVIGVIYALRQCGVRVPEDISVVASDHLPKALSIDPFLTIAAQPAYEMGKRATELLLSRLAGVGPERVSGKLVIKS